MTGEKILNILAGSGTQLGLSDKNTSDTDYRAMALDWLNLVNKDISNRQQNFHWRWLEKTSTMPTVEDQHSYDLPDDIDTNKINSIYDRTNNWTYVFISYDEFVRLVPNPSNSTGSARWYTLYATTLRLYPVPSSVYTLFMDYVKTISLIADASVAIDIPAKYDPVIIDGVLVYVYKYDPDLGDWAKQQIVYEAGIKRMIQDNNMSPSEKAIPESHRGRSRGRLGRGLFPLA